MSICHIHGEIDFSWPGCQKVAHLIEKETGLARPLSDLAQGLCCTARLQNSRTNRQPQANAKWWQIIVSASAHLTCGRYYQWLPCPVHYWILTYWCLGLPHWGVDMSKSVHPQATCSLPYFVIMTVFFEQQIPNINNVCGRAHLALSLSHTHTSRLHHPCFCTCSMEGQLSSARIDSTCFLASTSHTHSISFHVVPILAVCASPSHQLAQRAKCACSPFRLLQCDFQRHLSEGHVRLWESWLSNGSRSNICGLPNLSDLQWLTSWLFRPTPGCSCSFLSSLSLLFANTDAGVKHDGPKLPGCALTVGPKESASPTIDWSEPRFRALSERPPMTERARASSACSSGAPLEIPILGALVAAVPPPTERPLGWKRGCVSPSWLGQAGQVAWQDGWLDGAPDKSTLPTRQGANSARHSPPAQRAPPRPVACSGPHEAEQKPARSRSSNFEAWVTLQQSRWRTQSTAEPSLLLKELANPEAGGSISQGLQVLPSIQLLKIVMAMSTAGLLAAGRKPSAKQSQSCSIRPSMCWWASGASPRASPADITRAPCGPAARPHRRLCHKRLSRDYHPLKHQPPRSARLWHHSASAALEPWLRKSSRRFGSPPAWHRSMPGPIVVSTARPPFDRQCPPPFDRASWSGSLRCLGPSRAKPSPGRRSLAPRPLNRLLRAAVPRAARVPNRSALLEAVPHLARQREEDPLKVHPWALNPGA